MQKTSEKQVYTQMDLARLAGVSHRTVHRALTSHAEVSEGTRQRVMELARKLGYRPNVAAQAMRQGRFKSVALVAADDRSRGHVPSDLFVGIDREVRDLGWRLSISSLPDEKWTDEQYVPQILKEWSADGMLIAYVHGMPERVVKLIQGHSLPSVWMNVKLDEAAVYPDDLGGGRMATEHLLRLGHQRVWFYSNHQLAHYSVADRAEGYRQVMREAGLEPRVVGEPGTVYREAGCVDVARGILSGAERPSALVCYDRQEAVTAYVAAGQLGIKVPEDLSIMSFGVQFPRVSVGLPIAICQVPFEEVGREAVRMLVGRIEDPEAVVKSKVLPFQVSEGWSCVKYQGN